MSELSDGFAKRLKKIRKNCGFTQQQMADALSVHRTTYTYYELGRSNPPRDVLNKLVAIFDISYDDLLSDTATDHPNRVHCSELTAEPDKLYNLSKEERGLLLAYRLLPEQDRAQLDKWVEEKTGAQSSEE